jgi:hypothetical protein
MKITFEIVETISEIREYCESNKYWDYEMAKSYDGVPYRNKAKLVDLEFTDSSTEMTWIGEKLIFNTAWSGFEYEIEERNGKTYCSYNGAVKGFLKQSLMPPLTPAVNIHDCKCYSSTHGSMFFGDYLLARGLEYQWLLFM